MTPIGDLWELATASTITAQGREGEGGVALRPARGILRSVLGRDRFCQADCRLLSVLHETILSWSLGDNTLREFRHSGAASKLSTEWRMHKTGKQADSV